MDAIKKEEFEKQFKGVSKKVFKSLSKYTDYGISTEYLWKIWPTLSESIDDVEHMNIDLLALTYVYMYINSYLQPIFTTSNDYQILEQYKNHILSTPININLLDQIITKVYGRLDKLPKKGSSEFKNDFRLWSVDEEIRLNIALSVAIYASKIITAKQSS